MKLDGMTKMFASITCVAFVQTSCLQTQELISEVVTKYMMINYFKVTQNQADMSIKAMKKT